MSHEILHGVRKMCPDLRVRLCLKIGGLRARAVQHGSTAVGATALAVLRKADGGSQPRSRLPDADA